MTRDEAKKLLPIITAFANGKRVQRLSYADGSGGHWEDIQELHYRHNPEAYRIKPKNIFVGYDKKGIPCDVVTNENNPFSTNLTYIEFEAVDKNGEA